SIAGMDEDALRKLTHARLVFYEEHSLRRALDRRGDHRAEHLQGDVTARTRPVDPECRPQPGLAVHPDVALALLDDAVGRRQAKAGAFPRFLGRKEGLEEAPLGFLGHPAASVGD